MFVPNGFNQSIRSKRKSYFTKVKNKLLNVVSDVEELSKTEIRELQTLFDQAQDNVSSVLEKLCITYNEIKDIENIIKYSKK